MSQWVTDTNVEDRSLVSDYPFKGYDEAQAIKGQIEYRIFFSNANTSKKLKKPIIIIDGFDPGDKRQIQRKDYPQSGNGKYIPGESRSIEEMMTYGSDGNGDGFGDQGLIPKLRSLGYDVIIVNNPTYTTAGKEIDGGADYIERNGLNLVSLIEDVNQEVATHGNGEKLVIVGPSMGGQISRYALAWMEKNGKDHNTRLWISMDSPHLGANIPIGVQSLVHMLATVQNVRSARDFYFKQLKSVAAQQQLIEQHLPYNNPSHLNNGSLVRQRYQRDLTANGLPGSNGYPQNLRKIAIANGSLVGKKVGTETHEDLRLHGFVKYLTTNIKATEMSTTYMPAYGKKHRVNSLVETDQTDQERYLH